ncbi:hypothetical protein FRC12_014688, partial [Ceratobasidium sp. 428]
MTLVSHMLAYIVLLAYLIAGVVAQGSLRVYAPNPLVQCQNTEVRWWTPTPPVRI